MSDYNAIDVEETPTQPLTSQPGSTQSPIYSRSYSPPPSGGNNTNFQYNRRPSRQWINGIFDCSKNLYPSCFCACFVCYGYYLLAQMAEKTGFAKFSTLIYIGIGIYIFCIILQIIFPPVAVLAWITFIFTVIFAINLRLYIVKRENIQTNWITECCTGLWCHWCSVAQMARHIYGYTEVLDGDGMIERPDQYVHNGVSRV